MSKKILITAAFLAIAMPFSAQAQGVPAGMNYGAAVGYQAAGPIGAVVGGGVGGVAGGIGGVLGIGPQYYYAPRYYSRRYVRRHHRRYSRY
jgi:hypothetical protein